MAKSDMKIHEQRMSGAAWMLEFIKNNGIEAAEDELARRKAIFIPLEVSKDALEKSIIAIKNNTIDTICLLSAATLHDEFGFGHDRLMRFVERFNLKTDCLVDDKVSWGDYIEALKDETGIGFSIRKND